MNTTIKNKDELEQEEQGVIGLGLPEGMTLYKPNEGSGGENNTGSKTGSSYSYAQSAPSYINQYQNTIDRMRNGILNREAFTYDPNTDPMYQQYKDSYTRQGQQAMEDTLAQVSARTGGLASSYAGTAAQQTYNNYMSALADKVPELRQLAYEMYMDEGDTMRQNLQMLQGLENTAYGRYRDSVADNQWQQTFDTQNSQWQQKFDYDKNLAAAQLLGEAGDYSGYQGVFGLSDEKVASLQEYNAKGDKLAAAQLLAQAGDYSGYQALLNLTDEQVATLSANYDSDKLLTAAELMAQAGDFSGYKSALNLTDEQVATLEAWYQNQNAPKVSYSGNPAERNADYKTALEVARDKLSSGGTSAAVEYLNNLVDNGFLSEDDAVRIYTLELGGEEQKVPGTFEEYMQQLMPNIATRREFARVNRNGQYKDYNDYLAAMYEKYKGQI